MAPSAPTATQHHNGDEVSPHHGAQKENHDPNNKGAESAASSVLSRSYQPETVGAAGIHTASRHAEQDAEEHPSFDVLRTCFPWNVLEQSGSRVFFTRLPTRGDHGFTVQVQAASWIDEA